MTYSTGFETVLIPGECISSNSKSCINLPGKGLTGQWRVSGAANATCLKDHNNMYQVLITVNAQHVRTRTEKYGFVLQRNACCQLVTTVFQTSTE